MRYGSCKQNLSPISRDPSLGQLRVLLGSMRRQLNSVVKRLRVRLRQRPLAKPLREGHGSA
jgi:hypothetical protein